MHSVLENVFIELFRAGSIVSITLHVVDDRHAMVYYRLATGEMGRVFTKRGQPKEYVVQTALALLKSLGCLACEVDMRSWVAGAESQPKLF